MSSLPASELRDDLLRLFRRGVDAPLDDGDFDALARRVFDHQAGACATYGAFARGRGVAPGDLEGWRDIPPVPVRAFKEIPLVSGDPARVERTFRTSGTTAGREKRGEHHVLDLTLYRESLLPAFRAHLLPDGAGLPLVSLIPSPEALPDSSLSWMIGVLQDEVASPGGGYFVSRDGAIDEEGLAGIFRESESAGRPILVAGTAFALVHWMDAADRRGETFTLADGSRVMETGGFKGRARSVSRPDFYQRLERTLGIQAHRIVNEYGMTELLTQFYEPVLRGAHRSGRPAESGASARRHLPPPWLRTRVLHPVTLAELPPGEPGLLAHFDLANLYSVSAILTEDRGSWTDEGLLLLGRTEEAEPRGCSIAMDELLSLARD